MSDLRIPRPGCSSQARLASPVCRYQEGSVSESAEALVDKPAIQRYGADGGVLRIRCSLCSPSPDRHRLQTNGSAYAAHCHGVKTQAAIAEQRANGRPGR
jgi:hypothetical protein